VCAEFVKIFCKTHFAVCVCNDLECNLTSKDGHKTVSLEVFVPRKSIQSRGLSLLRCPHTFTLATTTEIQIYAQKYVLRAHKKISGGTHMCNQKILANTVDFETHCNVHEHGTCTSRMHCLARLRTLLSSTRYPPVLQKRIPLGRQFPQVWKRISIFFYCRDIFCARAQKCEVCAHKIFLGAR